MKRDDESRQVSQSSTETKHMQPVEFRGRQPTQHELQNPPRRDCEALGCESQHNGAHNTICCLPWMSARQPWTDSLCMNSFYMPTRVPVPAQSTMTALPDEVRCKYPSKRCESHRTLKRSGELHRFCEFHRTIANRNQRRLDQRRRQRKLQLKALRSQQQMPTSVTNQQCGWQSESGVTLPTNATSSQALTMATPEWNANPLWLVMTSPTSTTAIVDANTLTEAWMLPPNDLYTLGLLATDNLLW